MLINENNVILFNHLDRYDCWNISECNLLKLDKNNICWMIDERGEDIYKYAFRLSFLIYDKKYTYEQFKQIPLSSRVDMVINNYKVLLST